MKKPVLNIAPGQTVNYHGEPCLVLEHRKDGTMLLHLDQMTHAFGSSNNFAASSLRSHLNGPYLASLTDGNPDKIITRTVDLTALNGSKEYGSCECKVAPLTIDELRKYHDILPLPERFEWSVTPWSTPAVNEDDTWVMGRSSNGGIYRSSCYYSAGPAPLSSFPPTSPLRLRATRWSSTAPVSWRRKFSAASPTKG